LTEPQALARPSLRLPGARRAGHPRALANHDTRGALKLVIDVDTLTVDDVADSRAPYLTMAEALRICAELFRSTMPTGCCA